MKEEKGNGLLGSGCTKAKITKQNNQRLELGGGAEALPLHFRLAGH